MPSEIDSAGQQAAESTGNDQSGGTASIQDEEMSSGMEERYKAILLGEEDFARIDYRGEDKSLNIKNIKTVVSDEDSSGAYRGLAYHGKGRLFGTGNG